MVAIYQPGETIYIGRPRSGVWVSGPSGLTFLLRDDFTTAASAPLTSPRTAEPGPGTLTITDTNNKLSIIGGKLDFATGGLAAGDPGVWGALQTRLAGRAVIATQASFSTQALEIGWDANDAGFLSDCLRIMLTGNSTIRDGGTAIVVDAFLASTDYSVAVIQRGTGFFAFVKGGIYTNWTLSWVGVATSASVYPALSVHNGTTVAAVGAFRVLDLPAPFATDYGIATQRLSGARTAGDTFTHEADCIIEGTITTLGSTAHLVFFRVQTPGNSDNVWSFQVDPNGDVSLTERVAASNTVRGTSVAGVANGHRFVIVCSNETIRIYTNNVLRITYASAANFKTATAGVLFVLGTGGAVSDIVSFPRTLTGAAASLLDSAVA